MAPPPQEVRESGCRLRSLLPRPATTSAQYPTIPALTPPLPASDTFGYDAAGNRDDDPGNPVPWAYDANNRITASPGGLSYTFDADGNVATRGDGSTTVTTTYDRTNRLRTWTDGTMSASYQYDPFGRRVRKTVGPDTTWYFWDGDQLLAEYDGTGARTARYAYAGGFAPVEYATPNLSGGEDVFEVHTDHLDTPRLLTDSSGTPVWRAAYEAFGTAHLSANTVTFNVRFPGQYYDGETGLHYNRFRYYDPEIGRYASADPSGQAAGVNLYLYGSDNPQFEIDPTGEVSWYAVRKAFREGRVYFARLGRVSESIARNRRLLGKDIEAAGPDAERAAKRLEGWVAEAKGSSLRRDAPHAPDTAPESPAFKPHYQTEGHPGHTFVSTLNGLVLAFLTPPSTDAALAGADALMNAGQDRFGGGGKCGGAPGGDELAGQFTGGLGALNRK